MTFAVRQAWPTDLDRLAAIAADAQRDPKRFCSSLGADVASITADIADVADADSCSWTEVTWVAVDDDREVLGWVAADRDADMGRVWWWGPVLADTGHPLNDAVLDALLDAGERALPEHREFEFAFDSRSTTLHSLAVRRGAVAEERSVALRADRMDVDHVAPVGVDVMDAEPVEGDAAALHDALFPNTHTPGTQLFAALDDRHDRLVARQRGRCVGYVATELQQDGSLYIDFLGVADDQRGKGIGRALIAASMQRRSGDVTHAHLVVRESNTGARALYASLGFVEERILVPFRKGFTLP